MKYEEFYNEGMTVEQFNETMEKVIQSETDKVRTKYSADIKELQSKLPKDKSESEIEFETRLKNLEAKENEYKLMDTLTGLGLPSQFSKFLKGSDDMETFAKEFQGAINDFVLNNGYKPSGHKSNETTITKEQFKQMGYSERAQLFESNPELYKALSK